MKEEVYLLKFISLLKLYNYWHHKWNAGCTAKIGLKLLALMSYGISVFPLWCKFRTNCNPVSVREKPSSYGQDSIYSPQLVVFSVFDQFSDLDLRHNIFNPIIFISNKKLSWDVCQFCFISEILFLFYSEKKHFVSRPSRSYWVRANKRIFNYLCLIYQKNEKRGKIILLR